jgi:hypothetical protein
MSVLLIALALVGVAGACYLVRALRAIWRHVFDVSLL